MIKKGFYLAFVVAIPFLVTFYFKFSPKSNSLTEEHFVPIKKRSFSIDVKTVGELEAVHSTAIASMIRGDHCKIIYLIQDGVNVQEEDVLVKLDSTPFEEKVLSLETKVKEQQAYAQSLNKGLDWEISQAERDDKTSALEGYAAELELN